MKKIIILGLLFLSLGLFANAQRVSVRLDFPVGVSVMAPGPAPFRGAVWVAPEWRWQRGRYVATRGYWARPYRHRTAWVSGYWKHGRRGYVWVPGRWR